MYANKERQERWLALSKYSLQKTTFLYYYQVVSAIPSHLLTKAKTQEFNSKMINAEDPVSFRLDENVTINLLKAKSKDFYWLIIKRKYKDEQTGPKRWNKIPVEKQTGERYLNRFKRRVEKTD